MFEYDDYTKAGGAGSDRGWVRLADPTQHPQYPDFGRYADLPWLLQFEVGVFNVGNWLDYEHGEHHKPGEPTIHATAYLCRFGPSGRTGVSIGHGWFHTIAEAKAWIEATVRERLAAMKAIAA